MTPAGYISENLGAPSSRSLIALIGVPASLLVSPTSVVTAEEGGLQQMTAVVEFDSYEIALAAYESADYKKALAVLGSGVERDFRIAEGA